MDDQYFGHCLDNYSTLRPISYLELNVKPKINLKLQKLLLYMQLTLVQVIIQFYHL